MTVVDGSIAGSHRIWHRCHQINRGRCQLLDRPRPLLRSLTSWRSSSERAPPAYVAGSGQCWPKNVTSSLSMPPCKPSTSAACTRTSAHNPSRRASVSAVIAVSVIVCQRSVATCHGDVEFSTRRQDKSMTNRSGAMAPASSSRRCQFNTPSVNSQLVTIT